MSGRSLVGGGVALGVHDGGPDGSALAHDVRLRGWRGAGGVFRFARASLVSCAVFAGLAGVSTSVNAALWANASSMVVRGSNGLPITVRMPEALASVSGGAAGAGGAVARASVPVVVGGVSTTLELSKPVPVANLARVARVAARLSGPLALAGLVYDGVQWLNDSWGYSDPATAWQEVASRPTCAVLTSTGARAYRVVASSYTYYYRATSHVHHGGEPPVPGAEAYNYCQNPDNSWDALYQLAGQTSLPENEVLPATDQHLEISFQQGLISSPASAASVLDAATAAAPSSVSEFGSEPVSVSGPATVDGGTRSSSSVGPNGTVTTTVQTTYNFDYSGDTVNITETQVTTVTDVNGSTVTTTTTQVPPSAEPVSPSEPAEDVECGLPGMPPCKIDETGTPTGEDVRSQGDAAIQEGYDAIDGGIRGLGDAPVDDLGWSWSFEFPAASCSALVINFRSYSRVVDWCPILGQMRDIWGWAVGVMGALFVWRRATSPM